MYKIYNIDDEIIFDGNGTELIDFVKKSLLRMKIMTFQF